MVYPVSSFYWYLAIPKRQSGLETKQSVKARQFKNAEQFAMSEVKTSEDFWSTCSQMNTKDNDIKPTVKEHMFQIGSK